AVDPARRVPPEPPRQRESPERAFVACNVFPSFCLLPGSLAVSRRWPLDLIAVLVLVLVLVLEDNRKQPRTRPKLFFLESEHEHEHEHEHGCLSHQPTTAVTLPEGGTITVTHPPDGRKQTHTVKKGGGY